MKKVRIPMLALAALAVPAFAQSGGTNNSRDTSGCQGYTGKSRQQCVEKILNSAKPGEGNTAGGASKGASTGGTRVPGAEGIGSGGSQGPGVGATGSGSSGTSRPVPGSSGDRSISR